MQINLHHLERRSKFVKHRSHGQIYTPGANLHPGCKLRTWTSITPGDARSYFRGCEYWAMLRESMLIKCANNRGLDQPTHRCSQTRAFALRCMRTAFLFHILLYVYGKHLMSCTDSYVPRQTFRGQFTSTKCKFFHHYLRIGGSWRMTLEILLLPYLHETLVQTWALSRFCLHSKLSRYRPSYRALLS